jgi:hypothetical protein
VHSGGYAFMKIRIIQPLRESKMADEESKFLEAIAEPGIISELHHLLHIEPFRNEGSLDYGWSCRDHAWTLTLLAKVFGLDAVACHGKLDLVGRTSRSQQPLVVNVGRHSWTHIAGNGFTDLSLKRQVCAQNGDGDDCLQTSPVVRNRLVGIEGGRVWTGLGDQEREILLSEAQNAPDIPSAIYTGETYDEVLSEYVDAAPDLINSPLTDRLKKSFSGEIYAKLVLHLSDRLKGKRSTSEGLSKWAAWQFIDDSYDDANSVLKAAAGL